MGEEPIYTAEQVREILGLKTVRTVHRLIKRKELDSFTVGRGYRIRKSALDRFTRTRGEEDREVERIGA
jgi:excisionase family DNA binding protein